jgi:hypothetical protein
MSRASASALTPPWAHAAVLIRLLIRAVVATLALFHAWLLASQVARGDLAETGLALRWIVAACLITALVVLWRSGESLAGRRAVAVWLLAALLHGPALAERQVRADNLPSVPEAVASVLLIAGPAGLTLLLLAALTRRPRPRARAFIAVSRHQISFRPFGVVASWSCAPRPPPCI